MVDGVDDQIGKVLLFLASPRVTASILILQRRNNTVCEQRLCSNESGNTIKVTYVDPDFKDGGDDRDLPRPWILLNTTY